MVSIWANTGRPNTPDFVILMMSVEPHKHVVSVNRDVLHVGADYLDCHRWACNKWGLTSTEMLPVRAAYEEDLRQRGWREPEPEAEQAAAAKRNRFRKQGV